MESRSALGRHLAGETGAFAREILSRTPAGPLLSRALGAGMWLFAEVYSHVPLLPSPIPETSARKARPGKTQR